MFTRPLKTKTVRTKRSVRPFDPIPGSSTKAGEDSDEAEDSSDEAEDLNNDQAPEDHDGLQEARGRVQYETPAHDALLASYGLTIPENTPHHEIPSLFSSHFDPRSPIISSQPNQKHTEETTEEYSNFLRKLTISRDRTEASNFEAERLLAIAANTKTPAKVETTQGINSGVQGSPMAQSGLDGQDLTFAGNGPRPGSMPLSESSRPGGLGFQNTHPVQTTGISVQNHGNTAESALVSRLLRRIEDLERGAITPEHPPVQGPSPPRFQILHVLDEISDTVCLQEPTWTFDIKAGLRLKAESPLMNLDTYLRKNDDISFLVYKTYKTPRVSASELAESIETGVLPTPEPSYESIRIMSQELEVALAIFLKSACSLDEEQHDLLSYDIPAPYLFWYRGRSKRHTLSHLLPKYRAHLELLFDWIERNYATKFDQFDEMISRGRISHAFTEYLFFPGDVVIKQDGDKTKAYQLQGMPEREKKSGRTHHSQEFEKSSHASPRANGRARANEAWIWEISCWTIVYDGQFYRQNEKLALKLVAESHDEEVDIAELTVVPLLFVGKDLQEQLLQRGRTFWSCRVRRPISYNGRDGDTSHTDGERYVIDNESYKKLHLEKEKSKRNQEPIPGISNNRKLLFAEAMNDDEPPQAPYIYLFPPTIPGFSLRRKEWVDLVVDKIVDVSWNKEAFKHLVADDKTKELVQALVADRISSERNTDLIQGKGNGLIILLHGGPGTGKTFTAESVAELAEKPLYPVTCGDIGTEPEQVERYLESVLYLGNLWDCVVLLDEADVFLEERGIADLARNALVSVFLRVLEYYDGILILTSNRVGTFDEAFKSRISLALHYPNFTKSQRCRIWKNFLNRLKALKEPDIDFDDIECNIQELASEELNGRQIRNAITIGRQLAKFQKKELSYAHLKHVVEVAGQFETYVKGTKENLSGEEIARAAGLR
ncbi:hypothetical protein AA0119_g3167 [Alternaria tenuissima]|uniref:AAA+ ATPase domain-containing protein n=1 Tax=Alternaria tenuissima TaxID=119927 RepID=A0ABY0GHP7_9PLEO|nr:hypothetical protein AA0119_g3167 [Alternaria tenuissima]RYO20956.1 hypothetical protein AA0121_g3509 [Alternaria tenuissima]